MKTLFTFNYFWSLYHEINPQYKRNKGNCERIWDKINCSGKKKQIIKGIEKSKLSCYEYLKTKL